MNSNPILVICHPLFIYHDDAPEPLVNVAEPGAAIPALLPPPAVATHSAASAKMPLPRMDMDDGVIVSEEEERQAKHDILWELDHWFLEGKEGLSWKSKPEAEWKKLQPTFPLLALLARRFLSILPSCAPSERVWSRFGHIIDPHSSTIDSTRAAQLMYVRDNPQLRDKISP